MPGPGAGWGRGRYCAPVNCGGCRARWAGDGTPPGAGFDGHRSAGMYSMSVCAYGCCRAGALARISVRPLRMRIASLEWTATELVRSNICCRYELCFAVEKYGARVQPRCMQLSVHARAMGLRQHMRSSVVHSHGNSRGMSRRCVVWIWRRCHHRCACKARAQSRQSRLARRGMPCVAMARTTPAFLVCGRRRPPNSWPRSAATRPCHIRTVRRGPPAGRGTGEHSAWAATAARRRRIGLARRWSSPCMRESGGPAATLTVVRCQPATPSHLLACVPPAKPQNEVAASYPAAQRPGERERRYASDWTARDVHTPGKKARPAAEDETPFWLDFDGLGCCHCGRSFPDVTFTVALQGEDDLPVVVEDVGCSALSKIERMPDQMCLRNPQVRHKNS